MCSLRRAAGVLRAVMHCKQHSCGVKGETKRGHGEGVQQYANLAHCWSPRCRSGTIHMHV